MNPDTLLFKVILLGDCGVGKTCLLHNYLDQNFDPTAISTIGVEFGSKMHQKMTDLIKPEHVEKYQTINNSNNNSNNKTKTNQDNKINDNDTIKAKVQIWGTSGQERFRTIVKSYFRNTQGIILVCDLTRRETLDHIDDWIKEFKNASTTDFENVGCILVGNKSDLTDLIQISDEELAQKALKHQIPFFKISCKTDKAVIQEAFTILINDVFQKFILSKPAKKDIDIIDITQQRSTNYGGSCCGL